VDTHGNPRQFAGVAAMRVKEFWQWLSDLADATDNAPVDMPSAEHAFLMGRTVAEYLKGLENGF
jgi:truncated hemoglobin YjbI